MFNAGLSLDNHVIELTGHLPVQISETWFTVKIAAHSFFVIQLCRQKPEPLER